ncbi:MAG: hypothetical protein MAGBODY4_00994 [Candidatus Marinimicrobia bacterium]|nr:hypothetical protein [Candidatus Neomarinimicrobiota bacterium]
MRGHAAAGRQNTFGRIHTPDIFRAGFEADQNYLLAALLPFDRIRCVEDYAPTCSSGTGRQSFGQFLAIIQRLLLFIRIEDGTQQLIQIFRVLHAEQRGFLIDQSLFHHFGGHADCGDGRPLAVPRLEHPEFAVLDGELEILHIFVVCFQFVLDLNQFFVLLRHLGFQGCWSVFGFIDLVNRMRRPNTGNDIFALGVRQIFAVELVLAGGGISGESHAGSGPFTQVPEDHRLHVDRRAPFIRNVVQFAVCDSALVIPGAEDRPDSHPELLFRVFRERLAGFGFNNTFIVFDQFFESIDAKVYLFVSVIFFFDLV